MAHGHVCCARTPISTASARTIFLDLSIRTTRPSVTALYRVRRTSRSLRIPIVAGNVSRRTSGDPLLPRCCTPTAFVHDAADGKDGSARRVRRSSGAPLRRLDERRQLVRTIRGSRPWSGGRARVVMHLEDRSCSARTSTSFALGVAGSCRSTGASKASAVLESARAICACAFYDTATAARSCAPVPQSCSRRRRRASPSSIRSSAAAPGYFPFRETTRSTSRTSSRSLDRRRGLRSASRLTRSDDIRRLQPRLERYYVTATINDLATEGGSR